MTPGRLDEKVIAERSEWVRDMLEGLRERPLGSVEEFTAERRNVAAEEAGMFIKMAGYRNRLVRFYETVSDTELYSICVERRGDIESVLGGIHRWIRDHPERIERSP